jgi:ribbon-helix-helix protein
MGRHRVSVTFSLSSEQVELLDRLAQRTNVPKSVYVRKAVDAVLKKYRGLLNKDDSAPTDEVGDLQTPGGRPDPCNVG